MIHRPQPHKIVQVIDENPTVKTFMFEIPEISEKCQPGNFAMVWVPRTNEKPMSISYCSSTKIGITVAKVGKTTTQIHQKNTGDILGIRGPYGSSFQLVEGNILVAGGGVGMAPLGFLTEHAIKAGQNTSVVVGAKTKDDLLFINRLKKAGAEVVVTTEDGTAGVKGLVTDAVAELLEERSFNQVYTCGPEKMMVGILRLTEEHKVPLQASIERYVKCSVGLCGSCCLDPTGWRVCTEGPVFTSEELKKITEFGKYKRDAAGRKQEI